MSASMSEHPPWDTSTLAPSEFIGTTPLLLRIGRITSSQTIIEGGKHHILREPTKMSSFAKLTIAYGKCEKAEGRGRHRKYRKPTDRRGYIISNHIYCRKLHDGVPEDIDFQVKRSRVFSCCVPVGVAGGFLGPEVSQEEEG
ncbi:MAG: hypothetical protein ACTSXJ_09545 [Candidatus Baldrarchaeia archaeon]